MHYQHFALFFTRRAMSEKQDALHVPGRVQVSTPYAPSAMWNVVPGDQLELPARNSDTWTGDLSNACAMPFRLVLEPAVATAVAVPSRLLALLLLTMAVLLPETAPAVATDEAATLSTGTSAGAGMAGLGADGAGTLAALASGPCAAGTAG